MQVLILTYPTPQTLLTGVTTVKWPHLPLSSFEQPYTAASLLHLLPEWPMLICLLHQRPPDWHQRLTLLLRQLQS